MTSHKKPVTTIGSKELIDLVELDYRKVPAKVDTGADSSSIWASDIKELEDGQLSFLVFGPGSKFYSGTQIKTKTFKHVLVKNSSGDKEFRYKVPFLISVRGRKIRAWFTLADRRGMRYPVLLGRRLLKNKFVVDVGQIASISNDSNCYQVLILGSKLPDKQFMKDVSARTQHKVEFVGRNYKQLAFWLETSNVRVHETITNRDLSDFDLVYFKSHKRYYAFAMAAVEYLKFHHINFFDEELREHVTYDKLTEVMRLALNNINIPESFCGSSTVIQSYATTLIDKLGSPFVFKEINSDRSRLNYLLKDASDIVEILGTAEAGQYYLMQRYIKNQANFRVLVLGVEPSLAIKRVAVHNDNERRSHLNAPKGGSNASLLPIDQLSSKARQLAVQASSIMNRQIAGVDLVEDSHTKSWYVIEVNNAPQLYSGSSIDEKRSVFAKFIDNQLDR